MKKILYESSEKDTMTTREIVEAYISRSLYHEKDFSNIKEFENILWIKAK